MKQKLESLCRELQRQNKMVQVSGFWKPEGCEAASGPATLYPVRQVLYRRSFLSRSSTARNGPHSFLHRFWAPQVAALCLYLPVILSKCGLRMSRLCLLALHGFQKDNPLGSLSIFLIKHQRLLVCKWTALSRVSKLWLDLLNLPFWWVGDSLVQGSKCEVELILPPCL